MSALSFHLSLNYFYNSEKHLSSRYQETKNGAYILSVWSWRRREIEAGV